MDFDPDFLRRMWDRIDYQVLREAAETLGGCLMPCSTPLNCKTSFTQVRLDPHTLGYLCVPLNIMHMG